LAREFLWQPEPVIAAVPNTTGISTPAEKSDAAQFTSVALFSGFGLLISLVIVILRINGVF